MTQPQFLTTAQSRTIAYHQTPGTGPGVVFLGGFFNFRGLQNYFYSKDAKKELEYSSSPWQRIVLYICVYFGLLLCFLFILWLIMTATASAPLPPLM